MFMRKASLFVFIMLLPFLLFSGQISFSGAQSKIVLKEGRESVELTGGASVDDGDLHIEADNMKLSGTDWTEISCSGFVTVEDKAREINIKTSTIYFDRNSQRLLLSSYFELEDRKNGLFASGAQMVFDMDNEILRLSGQVRLNKIEDDEIIRAQAESMEYDRENGMLTLRANASVTWKGNSYNAQMISLDLENDTIELESKIGGVING